MDKNKLSVLKDIEYFILPTCNRCQFGNFGMLSMSIFGSCLKHSYTHMKHSDNPKKLSIHRSGTCHEWKRKEEHLDDAWEEFT